MRRQRVTDLGKAPRRLLVATDCLSEGINLQEAFTAVLHYDLPWNPNRLKQREGRVDRFGQTAESVKAYLLFGRDNPVDGLVIGVILEKVRRIRRDRGITVPFPEDSSTVLDTVAKALLFNPDRRVNVRTDKNQLKLGLEDFAEAREAEIRITHKIEEAAKRAGRIETAPESFRKLLTQAMSGKCSPRQAIKAHCAECVGFDRQAITECGCYACPLWVFRPYQKP